jgi:hypothetical protein
MDKIPVILDILDIIIKIVTVLGILTLVYAHRDSILGKKVLNLNVMEHCVHRFTDLLPNLNDPSINDTILKSYVDLSNEELFYISKKYLTEEVALEWIDGMIDFIPLYNCRNQLINEKAKLINTKWDQAIKGYPRIQYFSSSNDFFLPGDMESNDRRKELVVRLYERIKKYKY